MKTIIRFGIGCVLSLLTSVASAEDKPSKIPEYLLRFAFNPDLPDSRYIGCDGGPGSNVDGSYHNMRGIGGHSLVIGYANRKLKIDFTHKNGKEFSFQIGSYWWPPSGSQGLVRVAVFHSPGDEILLAVGGIPAAIIYPKDMRARVVGYNGDDKDKILTPESLAVFDKMTQPNPQAEQGAAGQPATRPELKSEDGQKPQPKSEGRSR
jgi:hypothetical protein